MTLQLLEIGGFSWSGAPSPAFVAFAVSALTLFAFWRRQAGLSRKNHEPLMDVRLFSIRSFRNGNVVTLVVGLGEFGIIAVMPLWLQFALDYSAFQAGLALVALAAGSFCASGVSFSMTTSALSLVRSGLFLEAAGLVMLGLIAATDSAWWLIAIALFVYGIGVGFATAQVTNMVLVDVPPESAGQGSGIQSAARELGSALGIAVLTTLFFSMLTSSLRDRLTSTGLSGQDAERLSGVVTQSAGSVIPSLSADPRTATAADAAREAMTSGLEVSSYFCAELLVLAFAATLFIAPRTATATPVREPSQQEPSPH